MGGNGRPSQVPLHRSVDLVECVREFHERFHVDQAAFDFDTAEQRYAFIASEDDELLDALCEVDSVKYLDALCDIVYFAIGTAMKFGWDFEEAFRRVHESNMTKLGSDGRPIHLPNGKIAKGPNYKPPRLEDLV